MIPIKLRLRGFKGIKAGMGLDEITIDFTKIPDGITAISAPNGTGKTTILDNIHAYRVMPYRAGNSYRPTAFTYYDHTYGDAEKEFIFEHDEILYRSLVMIDTDRKKQEAYLYRGINANNSQGWEPYPGIDGKLEAYDRAIEEVLGSPELYFTSIFRAQNAKALSDYSKGDIKDIFVELLNISHLQAIREKARRIKQHLAGKVEILTVERKGLQDLVATEQQKEDEHLSTIADIDCLSGEIASYEKEIAVLQEQINSIDVKIGLQQKAQGEKDKIEADLKTKQDKWDTLTDTAKTKTEELDKKKDAINAKIRTSQALFDRLPDLRDMQNIKVTVEAQCYQVKGEITKCDIELSGLNHDLNNILMVESGVKEKEGKLSNLRLSQKHKIEKAEQAVTDAEKAAAKLETVPCTEDIAAKCRFAKDAVEAKNKLDDLRAALDDAFNEDPAITELEKLIAKLTANKKDPVVLREKIKAATCLKNGYETTLKEHEDTMRRVDKDLDGLPLAEQAEKDLVDLKADLEQIETEISTHKEIAEKEIAALKEDIDELIIQLIDATDTGADYTKEKQDLKNQQTHYETEIFDARTRDAELKKALGAIEEVLKQIAQAKIDLNILNANFAYYSNEIGEWTILEKAFGDDGIIALELDDAGPQISGIANELLQVFGGRFAIRIDTQTAKSDGKGNKEVFDITVFDNETNEQKSIKRLSGGEKTWIEDAVTKAITIYNKQASGRQFKTLFTDEKDGALDAEKKKEFFAMKRKVLQIGGYEREICITQTPELIAMADAIITLKKGGIEITTN